MIEYEDSHHLNNQFAEYLLKKGKIDWYNEQEEHLQRECFNNFCHEVLQVNRRHPTSLFEEIFYQIFLIQQTVNEMEEE